MNFDLEVGHHNDNDNTIQILR